MICHIINSEKGYNKAVNVELDMCPMHINKMSVKVFMLGFTLPIFLECSICSTNIVPNKWAQPWTSGIAPIDHWLHKNPLTTHRRILQGTSKQSCWLAPVFNLKWTTWSPLQLGLEFYVQHHTWHQNMGWRLCCVITAYICLPIVFPITLPIQYHIHVQNSFNINVT